MLSNGARCAGGVRGAVNAGRWADSSITGIDPETNRPTATIRVRSASGVAATDGVLWVIGNNRITRFELGSG